MRKLGFDPGAVARLGGSEELVEVTLERCDDDRWLISGEADDGARFSLLLRADFLEESMRAYAAARAREVAA